MVVVALFLYFCTVTGSPTAACYPEKISAFAADYKTEQARWDACDAKGRDLVMHHTMSEKGDEARSWGCVRQ